MIPEAICYDLNAWFTGQDFYTDFCSDFPNDVPIIEMVVKITLRYNSAVL